VKIFVLCEFDRNWEQLGKYKDYNTVWCLQKPKRLILEAKWSVYEFTNILLNNIGFQTSVVATFRNEISNAGAFASVKKEANAVTQKSCTICSLPSFCFLSHRGLKLILIWGPHSKGKMLRRSQFKGKKIPRATTIIKKPSN
jgi:hypothetical protein